MKYLTSILIFVLTASFSFAGGLENVYTQDKTAHKQDLGVSILPNRYTGCYLGAGLGSEFINTEVEDIVDISQKGYVIQGQIGCDYQFNNGFVLGAFGSYGLSNAEGEVFGADIERDEYYNVGVRAGYAFGRFLPYLGLSYERANDGGDIKLGDTDTWRGHVGADYKLNRNWALGLDLSTSIEASDEKAYGYDLDTTDIRGLVNVKYYFK